MFERENERGFDVGEAFRMLEELERSTPEQIRQQRAHFRVAVKAKVTLLPGNSSALLDSRIQGVTGDLSEGGCRVLSPVPLRVGDVYRLEFDRRTLNLPVTFARCVRCSLLRDDAFEAGFAFFVPFALPEELCVASGAAVS